MTEESTEIEVNAVPDASMDILFSSQKGSDWTDVRLIGPTKENTPSYVSFEKGTEYIGIRFQSCCPMLFGKSATAESNMDKILFHARPYILERNDSQSDLVRYMISYENQI